MKHTYIDLHQGHCNKSINKDLKEQNENFLIHLPMKIFEKKKNQTIRGLKSDRRIERNKNTLTNNANAYTKLQETLKHFF